MTAKHTEPKWGFWIPVKDEVSAHYAAKMSGLPVFLMGLSLIVPALFHFANSNIVLGGVFLAACIVFVAAGFMIRKGRYSLLPVTVILWIVSTVYSYALSGLTLSVILSILIGLVAISGLRGWLWLRKHKT